MFQLNLELKTHQSCCFSISFYKMSTPLERLYGKYLDVSKFSDQKTVYVHHVKEKELHGIFFNAFAWIKLKSAIKNLTSMCGEFTNFLKKGEDPMTLEVCIEILEKWAREGFSKSDDACRITTAQEKSAMDHMLMVDGTFLPSKEAYGIGLSMVRLLLTINSAFEMFPTVFKGLSTNPTEWTETKAPISVWYKQAKEGLADLTTIIVGYDTYIRKHYKTLALVLPKENPKNGLVAIAILGDCDSEFWCIAREEGKRDCCTVATTQV